MEDLEEELPVVRRLERELEPGERNLAGFDLYLLIEELEERVNFFSVPGLEEEPYLFMALPVEEVFVRLLLILEERTWLDGYFLTRERELSLLEELLDTVPEVLERVIFDEDLFEVEVRRFEFRP